MPTNQFISLAEAIAMTKKYRSMREQVIAPKYQGMDILPFCETFDKTAFETLTGETGCVQIRAYLGMDENCLVKLIFVGVDSGGNDLLPPAEASRENESLSGEGNEIVEMGVRCPVLCPPPSVLNND